MEDRTTSDGIKLEKHEFFSSGIYQFSYKDDKGRRRTISDHDLENLRKREIPIKNGIYPDFGSRGGLGRQGLRKYEYIRRDGSFAYDNRAKKERIIAYAKDLKVLRKKVSNIKKGHPELNHIKHTTNGIELYKGEREHEDGKYYSYSYFDHTENKPKTIRRLTLDAIREYEKNIIEGHPERNKERYSTKGEKLRRWEVEDRHNCGYWGWGWNPIEETKVHFHAQSLSELRIKRERVERGLPPTEPVIRMTSDGKVLNFYEYELSDGKFCYGYDNRNGRLYVYADSLEELRWLEGNIAAGHPEWNRPNYTKDGQRLFTSEKRLLEDKVYERLNGSCILVADTPNALREGVSLYYRGIEITQTSECKYSLYDYFTEVFKKDIQTKLKRSTYYNLVELGNRYLKSSSLGCTFLDQITHRQIYEFLEDVKKKISNRNPNNEGKATVNHLLCILSQLFECAYYDELISRSPLGKAKYEKCYPKKKCRTLEKEELVEFRDAIKGEYYEPHIMFLIATGIRLSELRGLRWSDVDYRKKEINIDHNLIYLTFMGEQIIYTDTPKTKKSQRTIPLTKNLIRILNMVKERCASSNFKVDGLSDFIFTAEEGKFLKNGKLNRFIEKQVTKVNANKQEGDDGFLPYFSCHVLRHTFVTIAGRINIPAKVTAEIVGHANVSTTQDTYDECQRDMLQLGVETMGSYQDWLFGEGEYEKKSIAESITDNKEMNIASFDKETSAGIKMLVQTAKRYGAPFEKVIDDVKQIYQIEGNLLIEVVKEFWNSPVNIFEMASVGSKDIAPKWRGVQW